MPHAAWATIRSTSRPVRQRGRGRAGGAGARARTWPRRAGRCAAGCRWSWPPHAAGRRTFILARRSRATASPCSGQPENGHRRRAWANLDRAMHVLAGPWPARASWALLPPADGARARRRARRAQPRGRSHRRVLAWGTWMARARRGASCRRTVSLTALRVAAPAALGAANWAALAGDPGVDRCRSPSRARPSAVVAAFSPLTGEVFVNGRPTATRCACRSACRPRCVLGPVPLAWVAAVVAPVAGRAARWPRSSGSPARLVLAVGLPLAAGGRARAARARSAVGGASCRPGWCCTITTRWSSRCCSPGGRSAARTGAR